MGQTFGLAAHDLRALVLGWRAEGVAWRTIAAELSAAGCACSHEGLRRKFAHEPISLASRPGSRITAGHLVDGVYPSIVEMRDGGMGWAAVSVALGKAGFAITPSSLKSLVARLANTPGTAVSAHRRKLAMEKAREKTRARSIR